MIKKRDQDEMGFSPQTNVISRNSFPNFPLKFQNEWNRDLLGT
jgi:hypothetical protein